MSARAVPRARTGCDCRTASAASPTPAPPARPLEPVDQEWVDKALGRVPLAQLFAADMWRNTAIATFIACCSTIIYGTVAGWMPIYLAQERHWPTVEYGSFYIWWGLVGVARPDRVGLDLRPHRPARGVPGDADRGRDLPDPLGVRQERHGAVGVRPAVVDRLSRLLGAEHGDHRRGVPNPHPGHRQRLRLVGRLAGGLRAWPFVDDLPAAAHAARSSRPSWSVRSSWC